MSPKYLRCPEWSGAYVMSMLLALVGQHLSLMDAINVYTCGGEL